jgi:hypothetical protein
VFSQEEGLWIDTTKTFVDDDGETLYVRRVEEEIDPWATMNDQDTHLNALRAELEQVRGERDEALTKLDEATGFDGIMRQIDTYYPLEVPYFHDSSDPGCVAMRAQRQCLLATERAEKAEAERDAANRLLETEREVMRLALEAERDEAWTAYKQALNDNGVLKDLEYETRQERDALAAEVKRLEAVAKAADAQDPCASADLARALAAWREGEGGGAA